VILYKYLSPGRISVLEDRLIRFTQFPDLNDPFEANLKVEKGFGDANLQFCVSEAKRLQTAVGLISQVGFDRFVEDALAKVWPTSRRKLMEKHPSTPLATKETEMALISDLIDLYAGQLLYERSIDMFSHYSHLLKDMPIGVLSLSATWSSTLMWSHYADSHQGFIVGFNANDRLLWSDAFKLSRSPRAVIYDSRVFTMLDIEPSKIQDIYFYKSLEWAYEQEWRAIRILHRSDSIIDRKPYPIHLFRFNRHAISEIVLGHRVHKDIREKLLSLLDHPENAHIAIYQGTLQQGSYEVGRVALRL
jgi:Protein of unknown function (DUF2971)